MSGNEPEKGLKWPAGFPEMAKEVSYIVRCTTIDYHNDSSGGMQDTEVVGIFDLLKDANAAAKNHLTSQWDLDIFDTYDVSMVDGKVFIEATFPEGEVATVTVQKTAITTNKKKRARSSDIEHVFVLAKVTYEWDDDDLEEAKTDIHGIYATWKSAFKAAKELYIKKCGDSSFEVAINDKTDGVSLDVEFDELNHLKIESHPLLD